MTSTPTLNDWLTDNLPDGATPTRVDRSHDAGMVRVEYVIGDAARVTLIDYATCPVDVPIDGAFDPLATVAPPADDPGDGDDGDDTHNADTPDTDDLTAGDEVPDDLLDDLTVPALDEIIDDESLDVPKSLNKADKITAIIEARSDQ